MDSSSSSGDSSMSHGMAMTFFNARDTTLFSTAWTPSSTGAYAGTCIFLIVLSILYRAMFAYRHILELKWHDKATNRRYIRVAEPPRSDSDAETQAGEALRAQEKDEQATLTVRGIEEKVKVVMTPRRQVQSVPWRVSTDLPRAALFAATAGVGYLLYVSRDGFSLTITWLTTFYSMLAVMTYNVGYFFSILAGLFVGELATGRYAQIGDDHH